MEGFSSAEFDKFSTASLITRSTNDITQIQMVVMMMVRMVIYAPIMGVGGIIRAMGKDSSMWWLIAVAVGMLVSMIVVVFTIALPKFRIFQTLVDRLNLVARENLSGMMVIRAFNMQPFEEQRFDKANLDLTAVSLFVNRIMVIMMPMMMLIMNGLALAIIWVGAQQVANSQHAGGRYDGLHAVRHADRDVLPDALDDVHHPAARLGLGRPHRRRAGNRAFRSTTQKPLRSLLNPSRARSNSATSPSAIPAPKRMCSMRSALPPSQGRPQPSLGQPVRASLQSSI